MLQLLRVPALILSFCFLNASGFAQGMKDPTNWTFDARQTAEGEYEINISLRLEPGWHIWSMRPEGDGMQIPPNFEIAKQASVSVMGPFVEQGDRTIEKMEGIEKPVAFFSGVVRYNTHIRAKAGTTIKGTYEYQVCNDNMCLPPTKKEFSLLLSAKK